MNDSSSSRTLRRRAASAAVCSVVLAVVGGTVLAAPAHAATHPCATTSLVASDGTGVITPSAGGLGLDLLQCGVTVTVGQAPSTDPSVPPVSHVTTTPPPVSTVDPVRTPGPIAPSDGTTPIAEPSTPVTAAPASPASSAPPAPSPAPAPLSEIELERSATSVYPVKDGYRDSVKFSIHALDASGRPVPVQGTAVLSKGSMVAKRWTLDGSTTVLEWNGRVGKAVRSGVYTLAVTAWSADGTQQTQRTKVRVLAKHVERRAIMVRSNVGSTAEHAAMPKQVLKAFAKGAVTVRVRTDARVRGSAALVFSNDGVQRSVALKNGVHTTEAFTVFKGFERVTITHRWSKGAAKLKSVKAIWTYYTLV